MWTKNNFEKKKENEIKLSKPNLSLPIFKMISEYVQILKTNVMVSCYFPPTLVSKFSEIFRFLKFSYFKIQIKTLLGINFYLYTKWVCNIPALETEKRREVDMCIAFMHRKSEEFSRKTKRSVEGSRSLLF